MLGDKLAVSKLRETMKHGRVKCYASGKLSKLAINFITVLTCGRHLVLEILVHLFGERYCGLSV